MAKKICIPIQKADLERLLTRGFQSGNVSFLFGSGASFPAIKVAGNIEKELNDLLTGGKVKEAEQKQLDFLLEIQDATNKLFSVPRIGDTLAVLNEYQQFLLTVAEILEARRTPLLSKQATVFTTNYDVFFEAAAEQVKSLRLNDGFHRAPSMLGTFPFRHETFFETIRSTGNLFNYEYTIPGVNLIKLHGSLTWAETSEGLECRNAKLDLPVKTSPTYADDLKSFGAKFSLILPTAKKFHQTVLNRTFYDLLRIYANRLDIENSLLLTFGFSFDDEHILDITKRSLKNQSLLLVIFSHSYDRVADYEKKFGSYANVIIVHPEDGSKISFSKFNETLESIVSKTQNGT